MNEKPHILILPMYYPEKDSSPHRGYMFYEQAMQIAANGCRTGLAFTEQRPLKNFSLSRFGKESHFQISSEHNGTFTTMRLHAWNPKLSTMVGGKIWSLLTVRLVEEYIRRHGKPDLIHAHFGMWAGYAASLIRKRHGIDYIVTEHASSINGGNTTPAQASVLRQAYDDASRIICVGSMLARNLCSFTDNAEKICVIPNFVDTSTFRYSIRNTDKQRQFRFVSVGNLTPRKGFAELIQAFASAFPNQQHITLDIAGDGPQRAELERIIGECGLQGRVTLLGSLPREEVARLLGESDAFALHSYGETFGIVFIEAMACGLPCIGTVCGGPEDIITSENGLLHEPDDGDALVAQLRMLYDEYERFDKEHISHDTRKKYDFSEAGKRLKDIYLQVLTDNHND